MRALLFLLPFVVAGCSDITSVSQREILKRSQAEIDRREPWSATAAVFVTNSDESSRGSWKVRAGALDYSAYSPVYRGTYFIPGTERDLRFTPDGCLTRYSYGGSRCVTPVSADPGGMSWVPDK